MKFSTSAAPAAAAERPLPFLGVTWSRRVQSLVARLRIETVFAGVVLLSALSASILWALVLPFNAAPDEVHHFNIDWYIAAHNQLPIFDVSHEINHTTCQGNRGPCYASYASVPIGGPLLGAAFMKVAHVITGQPYERYPSFFAGGTHLDSLMMAARFASALCIGIYVVFLYLICRMFLEDPFVRLTALVIGAFIPEVSFVGGYVNDDSLGVASSAVMLYLSARLLRDGLRRGAAIATGVGLALLALSRLNCYSVFLIFAFCALLRLQQEWRAGTAKRFLGLLALAGAVGSAISGWWFVRGELLYRDPIGLTIWRRHIDAIAPGYGASTLAGQGQTIFTLLRDPIWRSWSFNSFWGEFDYMALPLAPRAYTLIRLGIVVGLMGACIAGVTYLRLHREVSVPDRWRAQFWVMFGFLIVLVTLDSLWNSLTDWFQPQGRYLFPALVPVALILAVGVHGWSSSRTYRALAFSLLVLGMIALNCYALMFVVVPAYNSW